MKDNKFIHKGQKKKKHLTCLLCCERYTSASDKFEIICPECDRIGTEEALQMEDINEAREFLKDHYYEQV